MDKSLIEWLISDDKGITIIHFLGISIGIFRGKYANLPMRHFP